MAKGIKPAKDRGKWKWEDREEVPSYESRDRVATQVNDWAVQWNLWCLKVLLPELNRSYEHYPPEKENFKKAMDLIQGFGDTVHATGCKLLDDLSGIYKYSPDRMESEGEGKRPPIVTDTTKPPPAPFGRGR